MAGQHRIVVTGIGLTAPNGNSLESFRDALLRGVSGVRHTEIRYMGQQVAGLCDLSLIHISEPTRPY